MFLRLLGLINIRLGGDFAYHWQIAGDIVRGKSFPLFGPAASVNPALHLGPLYYYLLAIPYFLGQGDFRAAVIFFSLISCLNIFLIYAITKELFDEKLAFTAAVFCAFSAYFISIGNLPWNPYLLPTVILLAVYSLIRIRQRRYSFLLLLTLSLGIAIELHGTAIFLLPVFLLLLPLKKIPVRHYISGSIILFIFAWPYFFQLKEIMTVLRPVSGNCDFVSWLQSHGHGERCFSQIRNTLFVFRFISMSLFDSQNIIIAILSALMTGFLLSKKRLKQRKLIIIWLGIPILLFLLYSANIYLHYFLILFPIPFFLLALFLAELEKTGRWGKRLSKVLFYSTIFFNIILYILSLPAIRT